MYLKYNIQKEKNEIIGELQLVNTATRKGSKIIFHMCCFSSGMHSYFMFREVDHVFK